MYDLLDLTWLILIIFMVICIILGVAAAMSHYLSLKSSARLKARLESLSIALFVLDQPHVADPKVAWTELDHWVRQSYRTRGQELYMLERQFSKT